MKCFAVYTNRHRHPSNEAMFRHCLVISFHSISKVKGEGYESTTETTIYLEEGDVLLFEDGERGYIKPVAGFVSIQEAIEDYENIKDLG